MARPGKPGFTSSLLAMVQARSRAEMRRKSMRWAPMVRRTSSATAGSPGCTAATRARPSSSDSGSQPAVFSRSRSRWRSRARGTSSSSSKEISWMSAGMRWRASCLPSRSRCMAVPPVLSIYGGAVSGIGIVCRGVWLRLLVAFGVRSLSGQGPRAPKRRVRGAARQQCACVPQEAGKHKVAGRGDRELGPHSGTGGAGAGPEAAHRAHDRWRRARPAPPVARGSGPLACPSRLVIP